MSARGYALHSVWPPTFLFPFLKYYSSRAHGVLAATMYTQLAILAVPAYAFILPAVWRASQTIAAYAADSVASQSNNGSICCRQCSEPVRQ